MLIHTPEQEQALAALEAAINVAQEAFGIDRAAEGFMVTDWTVIVANSRLSEDGSRESERLAMIHARPRPWWHTVGLVDGAREELTRLRFAAGG